MTDIPLIPESRSFWISLVLVGAAISVGGGILLGNYYSSLESKAENCPQSRLWKWASSPKNQGI